MLNVYKIKCKSLIIILTKTNKNDIDMFLKKLNI